MSELDLSVRDTSLLAITPRLGTGSSFVEPKNDKEFFLKTGTY